MQPAGLHHVELWLADPAEVERSWAWLLEQLGYTRVDVWPTGQSWRLGATYVVLESGSDVVAARHDRCRPGLNHLAFWVASRDEVDRIVEAGKSHGWSLLFPDRHPFAGGPATYAAYLENDAGFEVELVAPSPS